MCKWSIMYAVIQPRTTDKIERPSPVHWTFVCAYITTTTVGCRKLCWLSLCLSAIHITYFKTRIIIINNPIHLINIKAKFSILYVNILDVIARPHKQDKFSEYLYDLVHNQTQVAGVKIGHAGQLTNKDVIISFWCLSNECDEIYCY